MKQLSFILLICCAAVLFGQTITPNREWRIESGYACPDGDGSGCFCRNEELRTEKVGEAKTFDGKEYYELLSSAANTWDVVNYVREEDNKIYFYSERCGKELLMYDFGLNLGDDIIFVGLGSSTNCEPTEYESISYKYTVTEVDSVEYKQEKRKRLKITPSVASSRYDVWVEGIGSMRGINYTPAVNIGGGPSDLKDVYESDALVFENESPRFCWVSTTSAIRNDVRKKAHGIFRSKNNTLHITNARNIPLTIYDVQGRKIHTIIPNADDYKVNASFLSKGSYIVSNKTNNINIRMVLK